MLSSEISDAVSGSIIRGKLRYRVSPLGYHTIAATLRRHGLPSAIGRLSDILNFDAVADELRPSLAPRDMR